MRLRFCESEIGYWVRRYKNEQTKAERTEELQLIELKPKIQECGYLTKDELRKVAYWKSPRPKKYILENTDAFIKDITKSAFIATDDWAKLLILTLLRGVREPTASAILHLYDEEKHPILDIHALWSVGLPWEIRDSYPFWTEYVQSCCDIADRNGVSMRELDQALWKFSESKTEEERARWSCNE